MMLTSTELGYDFKRIRTAVISIRNQVVSFIGLIFFLCFAPIVIVFAILYFLEVPMEINDVLMGPTNPQYQNFFLVFLLAMGLPSLGSLVVIILGRLSTLKPSIYLSFTEDYVQIVYVVTARKHYYIEPERMIVLDLKTDSISKSNNSQEIRKVLLDHWFFLVLDDINDYKIKKYRNCVKFKFQVTDYRVKEQRRYKLCFDDSGEPRIIKEMIYITAYGNSNIRSLKTMYLESINQSVKLPINQRIQREILMQ
jgi:hypothetical protein